MAAARCCADERVADDALDAVGSVEALLRRDLVLSATAQDTTGAGVRPLRSFADDDNVDVVGTDTGKRCGDAGIEADRPQVDVVVEREAQLEQQPTFEYATRHGRVPHRAEQDRVMAADLLE